VVAVVTHDEIRSLGYSDVKAFNREFSRQIIGILGNVGFFERSIININYSVFDEKLFAGKGNDPFDKFVVIVGGGFKDDDIPTFGFVKAIA